MVAFDEYRRQRRAGYSPSVALQRVRDRKPAHVLHDSRGRRQESGGWWYDHRDDVPARWAGYAEGIAQGIKHSGWYTDDLCDGTLRGVVYRLSHGRGYLVGYQESCSDGVYVEYADTDSDSDAAYLADETARIAAEREREYNDAWHEGNAARVAIDSALTELRRATRETVWIALESAALDSAAEDRRRNDARDAVVDAWRAIDPPAWDRRLRDAYLEGLGGPVRVARLGRPAIVAGE